MMIQYALVSFFFSFVYLIHGTLSVKKGLHYLFSEKEIESDLFYIEICLDYTSAKEEEIYFGVGIKDDFDQKKFPQSNQKCFAKNLLQIRSLFENRKVKKKKFFHLFFFLKMNKKKKGRRGRK